MSRYSEFKSDWGWEDTWQVFLMLLLVTVVVFLGVLIHAPKKVDGYYMSRAGTSTAVTCVYAHWTWHGDEQSFCSDDYQKALDFASKANAQVK